MARRVIENCQYLDAHSLWRKHATPEDRRCKAIDTAHLERICLDAAGRKQINYFEINLAACRYGGVRAYFICPSESCRRRCTRLYSIDRHWLCRRCHGLAYQTQRLHKARRLLARKHKVLRPIDGVEPNGWLRPRPKGMWERTYLRLQVEADEWQERAFRHFAWENGFGES